MSVSFEVHGVRTPDKWQLRAAVWPVPEPRALCVLLNGMTEFVEKYGEVAEELNNRGFTVVSFDWRGQGASERRVSGARKGHVVHFEDYEVDLASVLKQVLEPLQLASPGIPVVALAHSMGAHVLLHYLHGHPRRFACAALCAPMLDVETGEYSPWLMRLVTIFYNLGKPSTRFVYKVEDRDQLVLPFEENRVTSDRGRYERTQALLRAQPYLRINGPTFGWLHAALVSMRKLRARTFAGGITTPLLVIGAGKDRVVRISAIRDFVKRLPRAHYVEIAESEHEILMEADSIRAKFWAAFDAFMDERLLRST